MSFVDKMSRANRERKWKLFLRIVDPEPGHSILDVGFAEIEYSAVDNYLERSYPYPEKITALGIVDSKEFQKRYPKVKTVIYDGKIFPFPDKSFDVCWSNAVLEHVGTREDQVHFLREIARVSDIAFITTPNRLFPMEVHTRTLMLHLLPKRVFDAYLRRIGKRWATGKYMNLLSGRQLKQLLSRAGISDYKIMKNKAFGFTIDFVVVFGKLGSA